MFFHVLTGKVASLAVGEQAAFVVFGLYALGFLVRLPLFDFSSFVRAALTLAAEALDVAVIEAPVLLSSFSLLKPFLLLSELSSTSFGCF